MASSRRKSSSASQHIKGPLSGQIALVTGATGGIGLSICRHLAFHGCSVAMHYNSDQDGAIELLDEFKEEYVHKFGSKFVSYKADMGIYDEVSHSSH
jgi:3-oxoacyl-[acyl-carrier protein] reductase